MMQFFLLFLLVRLSSTNEYWFAFEQYQFPGFYTPLFTLISSINNSTGQEEQKSLSFALSAYERSITVDVRIGSSNQTIKQDEQSLKLNIERADLLHNTPNHLIFIALRQKNKLETYVNCKLIDSYLLYSPFFTNEVNNNETSFFQVKSLVNGIRYFRTETDGHYRRQVFENFGCKLSRISTNNKTTIGTTIERPLIRKMQYVVEKVQKRKQRVRRHQNQRSSHGLTSDSITIIYKPNIGQLDDSQVSFHTILNLPQVAFHVRYYPREHLFQVRFNNENRTHFVLYADKSADLRSTHSGLEASLSNNNRSSMVILFLHITPTMITCYVNCELTDQEFVIDSLYLQSIIQKTVYETLKNQYYKERQILEYNHHSTLVIFNESIEQIAARFFCLKLDKKNEDLLPDKYALRKFANALDMLVNSLETPMNFNYYYDRTKATTPTIPPQNISAINIPPINSFTNLPTPSLNTNMNIISSKDSDFDKSCRTDDDCKSSNSYLKCQGKYCVCPARYFWSPAQRRCMLCKDLSVGSRCFRLSNHKSTWHEANDYCQDENSLDDEDEYTMKLVSNLNRTDIELLRHSLLHEDDGERLDYFYWIGSTSHFDTQKSLKHTHRNKRRVPTTIFRWYDNNEITQLNFPDIWCSQTQHMNTATVNNNELCVSLTSCGLYADDCQRNYRFLCEAV